MGAEVTAMRSNAVTPAQAGIHCRYPSGSFDTQRLWIPAFAGMTSVVGMVTNITKVGQ